MCVHACVCVCVAKPVAVELRCHATALIVNVIYKLINLLLRIQEIFASGFANLACALV